MKHDRVADGLPDGGLGGDGLDDLGQGLVRVVNLHIAELRAARVKVHPHGRVEVAGRGREDAPRQDAVAAEVVPRPEAAHLVEAGREVRELGQGELLRHVGEAEREVLADARRLREEPEAAAVQDGVATVRAREDGLEHGHGPADAVEVRGHRAGSHGGLELQELGEALGVNLLVGLPRAAHGGVALALEVRDPAQPLEQGQRARERPPVQSQHGRVAEAAQCVHLVGGRAAGGDVRGVVHDQLAHGHPLLCAHEALARGSLRSGAQRPSEAKHQQQRHGNLRSISAPPALQHTTCPPRAESRRWS
mmetsp:Transcript_23226/g.64945  ORF Transcript_23226/g.64945 Transcript_23226/m.64945 type:complete len:306 (-) Transcript_23226:29-946(-)